MPITGGHMNNVLRVDLTNERISVLRVNPELQGSLVGGVGIAAKILLDEVQPDVDPLGPANRLILAAGPLVGTFPGGVKWTACAKSPSTGIWGESSASGFWGCELKHAGFDSIVVQGTADSPVWLNVHDGEAQIEKASHLWGKETIDAIHEIQRYLDPKVRVACIGPAGEKLVRYASIVTDESRVCGRAGMGAVMGSKKLKAVAVRGTKKIPVADERKLRELSKEAHECVKGPKAWSWTPARVEGLSADGTARSVESLEKMGGLPIRNWTAGTFPEAINITGSTMSKAILKSRSMCPMCGLITCWRGIEVKSSQYAHISGRGPEYETCAALGSLCMNTDLESIAKANDLCNRLGIDTISAGVSIAFAMECFEKGIITKADTGGADLRWGNSDAIIEMVRQIGNNEGFGAVLGQGVKSAAEKIGRGAERYAMHVKGLEMSLHEPRRWWSMGLAYSTSNRGADHLQGTPLYLEWGLLQPEFGYPEKLIPFTTEGKAAATKFHQDFSAVMTALGMCLFVSSGVVPWTIIAAAYSAATGLETDHWDLLKSGERIWNLKRLFNVKMGVTEKDDTLPRRFLDEPLTAGPIAGKTVPLGPMLKEYYELRGWNDQGEPEDSKLAELSLSEIQRAKTFLPVNKH
jgi:aldehyde:ferredoxin oxidoreductase